VKTPRLREWREAMGETQVTLADKSGVAEHTISRIEHGASLRPTTARKLADALGVAVTDLMESPPVLASVGKGEAPETGRTVYEFDDEPRVTREQLREHGIEVNNSELRVLNQHVQLHERPAEGPVAIGYVRKKDEPVDPDRIAMLLAYVIHFILPKEKSEAWGEAARQELVASS
jgi:transcriptional regulator with XRE-family HTH domain